MKIWERTILYILIGCLLIVGWLNADESQLQFCYIKFLGKTKEYNEFKKDFNKISLFDNGTEEKIFTDKWRRR